MTGRMTVCATRRAGMRAPVLSMQSVWTGDEDPRVALHALHGPQFPVAVRCQR